MGTPGVHARRAFLFLRDDPDPARCKGEPATIRRLILVLS